jgi:tetratricopeptide (TPR) repeat protein
MFARLGIFASSFDLELAEAIADVDVDKLQSLVDKSLLVQTSDDRFAMLDTLRTFAREQLDAADSETLRRRQLQLIEEIAERSPYSPSAPRYSSEAESGWHKEIGQLLPDAREVLAWALERDPARAVLAICRLRADFDDAGTASEARTWLERALRQRSALPDVVIAEALESLGFAKLRVDELEEAADSFRESIEICQRLGNREIGAWAALGYAHTLFARGAHTDALALYEHALSEFQEGGASHTSPPAAVRRSIAVTQAFAGRTLLKLGEPDRAREMLLQALSASENELMRSSTLHDLADLELHEGRLERAEALYACALDTFRDARRRVGEAYCLAGLACVAALRGDIELAGEHWGCAERIDEEIEGMARHVRGEYAQILEPFSAQRAFRRGYEAARAAAITPTTP